jgi:hypothetical protein
VHSPRFLLAALFLSACAARQSPPVTQGSVGLDQVTSTVDSPLAAYYLSHYLAGQRTDPQLDSQIDQLLSSVASGPLSTDALVRLARASSNDFAALYFAERSTREHRSLKERFLAYSAAPNSGRVRTAPYLVVFVPGLFYKTHPETKGDLREAEQLVQSMGVATDRVESGDADTVEANAQRIADFITQRNDDGRELILVSASKGGPEVLYALGKLVPPAAARRVRAWVSIGGVLRGSPVADQYLAGPRSWLAGVVAWWMGFPCDMVASLSTARSLARFSALSMPTHIQVLHYVAVPLSGTITPEVRDPYETMQPHGPSDGLTLLTDELLPGGKVITDVGLDHRYADPRISAKTAALTRVVLDLVAESPLAI